MICRVLVGLPYWNMAIIGGLDIIGHGDNNKAGG